MRELNPIHEWYACEYRGDIYFNKNADHAYFTVEVRVLATGLRHAIDLAEAALAAGSPKVTFELKKARRYNES